MIFNMKHEANWEYIRQRKQKLINKNNKRDNASRISHVYNIGDKVLITRGTENKYEAPYKGPFQILPVNNNGTVHITVDSVTDTYNIRRLIPYHPENGINHGGECNMQTSKKRREHRQQSVTVD
jgi:hypothetical protein